MTLYLRIHAVLIYGRNSAWSGDMTYTHTMTLSAGLTAECHSADYSGKIWQELCMEIWHTHIIIIWSLWHGVLDLLCRMPLLQLWLQVWTMHCGHTWSIGDVGKMARTPQWLGSVNVPNHWVYIVLIPPELEGIPQRASNATHWKEYCMRAPIHYNYVDDTLASYSAGLIQCFTLLQRISLLHWDLGIVQASEVLLSKGHIETLEVVIWIWRLPLFEYILHHRQLYQMTHSLHNKTITMTLCISLLTCNQIDSNWGGREGGMGRG